MSIAQEAEQVLIEESVKIDVENGRAIASSKTATGHSLNDILAVGVPNISLLIDIMLDFMMGPAAFVGMLVNSTRQ